MESPVKPFEKNYEKSKCMGGSMGGQGVRTPSGKTLEAILEMLVQGIVRFSVKYVVKKRCQDAPDCFFCIRIRKRVDT